MKRQNTIKWLSLILVLVLMMGVLLTGCKSEQPTDDGHNHTHDTEQPDDGHTHDTKDQHSHKEPAAMGLTYKQDGKTFTLIVKDCKGNVVCTKKGLEKKAAFSQPISDGVTRLSWVIGNAPGAFECLYIDRLHCRVSDMIVGEQATDGTRILYTEKTDGKLNVVIRDLFDKEGFRQTHALNDAYLEGDYAVLNARMVNENKGRLSYLVNGEGAHRIKEYSLYPEANTTEKPLKTETSKKTEATKATEK